MILLTSTSDLLQIVTTGTQVVNIHASYADLAGVVVTPGRLNTSVSSATTTTFVGSPASSVQRAVEFLSVTNTDSTTPTNITLQHTDGTTVVPLYTDTFSLQPGRTLNYNSAGWQITPPW